jgi:hypothetical protein
MEQSRPRSALLIAALVAVFGPVVYSQSSEDSAALLDRAREKIVRTTRRLPKFTCRETIERTYYVVPPPKIDPRIMPEAPTNSCGAKEFGASGPLSLDAKDRLRLDVVVGENKEIFSWAAANRFDSRSVFQMVSNGPISMGSFGTYLVDIFENPGTSFKFTGKKHEGLAEVFEYAFEVPAPASHYDVRGDTEWKVTGYHGSFEIYSATAELARLVEETAELPPDTRMCRARTSIDYHYMLIGDDEFLIPRQSQLETLSGNANETSSITTFSGCHEYTAESSLRFNAPESAASVKTTAQPPAPLPPGLSVTLALLGAIDPRSAAAGDAIAAEISQSVRAPHSNQILLPAGAIAHGRILQMRHQYSSSQFLISIRFETLEANGVVLPLFLRWDHKLQFQKTHTQNGLRNRGPEFSLPPPTGESGAFFSLPAFRAGSILPAGFKSKWITGSP